jgi:thiol-disulfide isomerase/thioredoxin
MPLRLTGSTLSKAMGPMLLCIVVLSQGGMCQPKDLIRLDQLQSEIQAEKDRIQVVNFWATWCAPCLKELPLFEKLNAERSDIRVRLVSLDLDLDPNPEKVRNFVVRKKIKSEVIILDEKNPNEWIERIDKSWSGALPATLVINNKTGKRKFVEKELHPGELEKLIAEVQ